METAVIAPEWGSVGSTKKCTADEEKGNLRLTYGGVVETYGGCVEKAESDIRLTNGGTCS